MKIVKQIPAFLFALVFIVFGLMYFFKMMPAQTLTGNAAAFGDLMNSTGYMNVVKVLEVCIGFLFLFPKTRALAFALIAPIVLNIFFYEVLIAKQPGIGIVLVIINAIGLYMYNDKYKSILD